MASALLSEVRGKLATLEDTILRGFHLREIYPHNPSVYQSEPGNPSFFERMLEGRDKVDHQEAGKYEFYDAVPFSKDLPTPVVQRSPPANPLKHNLVNENDRLMKEYIQFLFGRQHKKQQGNAC